jgi:hypothetical protein
MGVLLGRLLRAAAEIQRPPGVVEPAAHGRQGGADPEAEQDPEDHHDGHVRR